MSDWIISSSKWISHEKGNTNGKILTFGSMVRLGNYRSIVL